MLRRRLTQVLPWLVAAVLLAYLLWHIPRDQVLAALGQAHLGYLALVVLYLVGGSLVADSWATARVLSWFLAPIGWLEILPIRAASYLMAIVNYHLGQAGLIYFVHRSRRVPVSSVTGLVLMMMGTVLLVLGALSVAGVVLAPDPETRRLAWVLGVLGGGTALYFLLLRLRPAWLARRRVLAPLFDAGVTGHLGATAVRVPHVLITVTTHLLAMRCFDIAVPLGAGLVSIPLMLLAASLPITPFGLGTIQLAAVKLLSPYIRGDRAAAEARVLAYSLSLSTLALVTQAVIGLIFLRRVVGLLEPGGDPPTPPEPRP